MCRRVFLILFLVLVVLSFPVVGDEFRTATVTLDLTPDAPPYTPNPPVGNDVISHIIITADDEVKNLGYWVNGDYNSEGLIISGAEVSTITIITNPLQEQNKKVVLVYYGVNNDFENNKFVVTINPHRYSVTVRLHLSMVDIPVTPNPNPNPDDDDDDGKDDGGGEDDNKDEDDPEGGNNDPGTNPEPENPKPSNPVNPGRPVVPDTPDVPDVPSEPENPDTPDTPGYDEPGSDEPYLPILPPAGSVYNLAGFIPLFAGFLLLFLVFFWRRKVYRILKSHAKKHGEKPEKEHLKEIADAIIKLVRDEGRYPEWKKNSDVAKRLSADIVSVLDEMNYARAVPRGALVAEIIKAARGRINRHRL